MPEYLFPGVYIEEMSSGGRGIPAVTMDKCCTPVQRRVIDRIIETWKNGSNVLVNFQGHDKKGNARAARALATDLGVKLYRVNLASVVSKYIGETEKNLK